MKTFQAEEDTEKDKGGLADGGNISPCLRKLRSKADAVVRVSVVLLRPIKVFVTLQPTCIVPAEWATMGNLVKGVGYHPGRRGGY